MSMSFETVSKYSTGMLLMELLGNGFDSVVISLSRGGPMGVKSGGGGGPAAVVVSDVHNLECGELAGDRR